MQSIEKSSHVQKLRDLLEKVDKATGPDRDIDNDLMRALEPSSQVEAFGVPDFYTASLDASIALVERMLPGWNYVVGREEGLAMAYVTSPYDWHGDVIMYSTVSDKSPPLALLGVMLRALISQAEGECRNA